MPVQQKFSQMWSFLRVPAVPIHPASRGVAAHTAGFYKVQVATTTTPRNILQTTFCPNSPPRIRPRGVFFIFPPLSSLHCFSLYRFGPVSDDSAVAVWIKKICKSKNYDVYIWINTFSVVEQKQDKQDLNLREQGLLWGCLVLAIKQLTCAAPPSNALSSVRSWGLQNWSCSTAK